MWIWFIFLQNLDFPTIQRLPSLTIVAHVITNFLAFVLREIRTIGGVPDALITFSFQKEQDGLLILDI